MPCAGNSLSELEESKGHYLCNIRLKPIVQRFKLPEADEPAGSAPADGTSQPAVGSDGQGGTTSEAAASGGVAAPGGAAPTVPEGYAPAMPGAASAAAAAAQNGNGAAPSPGSGAVDSMAPLI